MGLIIVNLTAIPIFIQCPCFGGRFTVPFRKVRTPKDNPESERFNQTLQYEFLAEGTFDPDPKIFNKQLTEWLIEYNFKRPHESLGYRTPIEFSSKVLPMYSSCTDS